MSGRVIVHSLAQARAALAAGDAVGLPVTLASAPGAGATVGALWFKMLLAEAGPPPASAVLDCGDRAGPVLAGLRAGFRRLRFTGTTVQRAPLAALAEAYGAVVEGDEPVPALDLLDHPEPEAACRDFLARHGTAG